MTHDFRSNQELLNYALLWAASEGPDPEDVMVTFGLTMGQFKDRLSQMIRMGQVGLTSSARLTATYELKQPPDKWIQAETR